MAQRRFILLVLLFGLVMIISLAIAEKSEKLQASQEQATPEVELPPELEALQQELVGKELPGALGKLFGNQQVNLYLNLDSGDSVVVGIISEKNILKSIQFAEVNKPTLEITLSETVVRSALQSPQPAATLLKDFREKKITVKAVGFGNRLKFGLVSSLVRLTSLFAKEEIAPVVVIPRKEAGVPSDSVSTGEEKSKSDDKKETEKDAPKEDAPKEDAPKEKEENEKEREKIEEKKEGPQTHSVSVVSGGFAVPEIKIKVGDTIQWENVRDGVANKAGQKALILGTQKCAKARSKLFLPGESFSWTFTEPLTCAIVDGIYTTQSMKVIVEK